MYIRKGDMVVVITGDDAGGSTPVTGRVLRVLRDRNRVVVEGINRVYKHVRPSRRHPRGGRLSKEMPIHVSNVLLFCPNCQRGVRIGRRLLQDGSKERYCKKCKGSLGQIRPPRKRLASSA
ncbi:MAG: 50S ribosomal protein L24 [Gemmataceae bacterium]